MTKDNVIEKSITEDSDRITKTAEIVDSTSDVATKLDDDQSIQFKINTRNEPSSVEPFTNLPTSLLD